jgi:phosphoglucosamine mutase
VLGALGVRAVVLHEAGTRPINDACGTEHPAAWLERVRHEGTGGLALDGDGDRMLLADPSGRILDGDHALAVLAFDAAARGRLPGGVVVGTELTNLGLEEALAARGARLERASVGDRNVAERMRALGALLGGEPSGHVVLPRDGVLVGDGLVAAVRVLQAARRLGLSLAEVGALVTHHPQVTKNVRVREKTPFDEVPAFAAALREAHRILDGRGRLVVRYSGTEPLLRIMAEGRDRALLERVVASVAASAAEPATWGA